MSNEIPSNEVTVETYSNEVFTDSVFNKAVKQTYSNSNISESKGQCERCNKESDELKDCHIRTSDDYSRMNLCKDCEKGPWSYIHGAKLVNE